MKNRDMKKDKLEKNIVLYTIKQISAILFPMVLYPYITRKLGVNRLGTVEYAKSITQYFILFAGLGISDYAIREGARIRNQRENFNQFATQVLFIHTISTVISLIACIIISFLPPFLEYQKLILIFSCMIPFGTLGVNWIFGIFEEYQYISVRTIGFQVISAVLTFLLIHSSKDYVIYAEILVLSSVGSNILNLSRLKRFFCLDFRHFIVTRHLKPIFLIFGMTLASSLYMTMDTSMLGFLDSTESVGYYSAANKLVIVIGTLVGAIRTVLLPRLSYIVGTKKNEEFKHLNALTLNIMIVFAIPIAFGIWCLSEEIIIIFCGAEFILGSSALRILVPEIVLSAMNGYLIYQIFMPLKHEKKAFLCILMGALTNLLTNAILIPVMHQDGAALATCISESTVLICTVLLGKSIINEWVDIKFVLSESIRCLMSSTVMFAICMIVKGRLHSNVMIMMFVPVIGAIVYFLMLIIFKEYLILNILEKLTSGFRKK